MKSLTSTGMLAAFIIANAAIPALAQSSTSQETEEGCFSSQDTLDDQGFYKYQTSGYCKGICVGLNKPVFALSQGSHCYCGTELPPPSSKVGDDQCNINCVGYPQETCGGQSTYQLFLSGIQASVPSAPDPSSSSQGSSPSSSTSASPSHTQGGMLSTVTQPTATVTFTAPGQAHSQTAAPSSTKTPSGGANKAGIAAGVVVGLVAVGAMIGGAILFIKHRRKRAVEEEYRRNVAINSFTNGGKSPNSSAGMSDSRLEPSVISQRRMSDGSIADNQDYSRRILKVMNPDGH